MRTLLLYTVALAVWSDGCIRCRGQQQTQEQSPAQTVSLIAAIQATLDHNDHIQESRAGLEGTASKVRRESGIFDPNFSTTVEQGRYYYPLTDYQHALALAAGINTYQQTTNYSHLNVQGNKLFESGTHVFTRFDLRRNADNLENQGGVNTTTFQAGIQVPLLGGRGQLLNTAGVRAASLELEGANHDLSQTTAALVTRTVEHYFGLVAAEERLRTARAAEDDARTLTGNVAELIRGDNLPAVAAYPAQASLDQAHAHALEAEQTALESRMSLGTDMGLDAIQSLALAASADDFSHIHCQPPTLDRWGALIARSEGRRPETAAAHARMEAAITRRDAAAETVRRRLDLTVDSGYTGLSLGLGANDLLRSTGSRVGANAEASLTYHFDAGRNTAKANLDAAKANVTALSAQENEAMHQIGSEVVTAASNLRVSQEELKSMNSAQESTLQSLEGERARLLAGESVLNDVLAAQKNLFDAQSAVTSARLRFAVSIARFRLATGTIFNDSSAHPVVESATFYSCSVSPATSPEGQP